MLGNCHKIKMEKTQNHILETQVTDFLSALSSLVALTLWVCFCCPSWARCLSIEQIDAFPPVHHLDFKENLWTFSAEILRHETCFLKIKSSNQKNPSLCQEWHGQMLGLDKKLHAVYERWGETSHSRRQLGLDGFSDHRDLIKLSKAASKYEQRKLRSCGQPLSWLSAYNHPSLSSYEISVHCICSCFLEGAAPAQQVVSSHNAESMREKDKGEWVFKGCTESWC